MKLAIVRRLAMFCFAAGLGSICLMAQGPLKVTIPFDFTVGSKSFTSGDYVVLPNLTPSVVAIRRADGNAASIALTHPLYSKGKSEGAKLIFNRYGNQYFLSKIWASGGLGRELQPSTAERELIAKIKSTSTVDLVATSRE